MRNTIFSILILLTLSAFSQVTNNLPIQGRLANSAGTPLTGSYAFHFEILGTNGYAENFYNVPVTNGLYSVVLGKNTALPNNLFQTTNERFLTVTVNSTLIDTLPIYAPIERDPSVPANVKDGVDWNEISNIPPSIYTDAQQLSVSVTTNGLKLDISGGNSVIIPQSINGDSATIGKKDTLPVSVGAAPNTRQKQLVVSSVWQSFTGYYGGSNMVLNALKVYFANNNQADIRLKIYSGLGNGGQVVLVNQLYPCGTFSTSYTQQTFIIPPTLLNNGGQYTFELIASTSTTCSPTAANFIIKCDSTGGAVGSSSLPSFPTGASSQGSLYFSLDGNTITSEVLSVNHNGNGTVGIGTPSLPDYMLTVNSDNSKGVLSLQKNVSGGICDINFFNNGIFKTQLYSTTNSGFVVNAATRISLIAPTISLGNSTGSLCTVTANTTTGSISLNSTSSSTGNIVLNTLAAVSLTANSGIYCTNDVYIGGTQSYIPTAKLQIGIAGDGTVAKANSWLNFSDRRYKKDIFTIETPLEKLMRVRGVRYNWISTNKPDIGFIAQEIEEVLPEIVNTDKDGYKSMDYSRLTPLLVEAVKELNTKNKQLEAEKATLQQQLKAIEAEQLRQKAQIEQLLQATMGKSKQ